MGKDQAEWGARARKDRAGGSSTSALCTRFTLVFHDVFNMFFKFPLYSLTHSQEHLTFIPYGLANVVLLSFIYIIKVSGDCHLLDQKASSSNV